MNYSHRCPKGNRQVRRVLNQAANAAAVKAKGTIFAIVYRRLVPRLGHAQAISRFYPSIYTHRSVARIARNWRCTSLARRRCSFAAP